MQGTGVQTDPYLIETWDDFFDMTNDSQSTYYMLANDLDGNDYNAGIFGVTNVVHTNLDGNGHTIRNLYYMGTSTSACMMRPNVYGGVWKNLTIENVQTNIHLFGYFQTQRSMSMQNCTISAECYAFTEDLSIDLTECTISLKSVVAYQSRPYNRNYRSTLLRCSANIRLSAPTSYWGSFSVLSSRLEMQLDRPPESINTNCYMTANNSVLAIRMLDATGAYVIGGDTASLSVLDSTLWGDTPTDGITGVILLPTADMKNADALNAAGFSVVRVS